MKIYYCYAVTFLHDSHCGCVESHAYRKSKKYVESQYSNIVHVKPNSFKNSFEKIEAANRKNTLFIEEQDYNFRELRKLRAKHLISHA